MVEDNPYGLLSFENKTYPALRLYGFGQCGVFGSFSKIIAPGMRVAWMIAPPGIRQEVGAC